MHDRRQQTSSRITSENAWLGMCRRVKGNTGTYMYPERKRSRNNLVERQSESLLCARIPPAQQPCCCERSFRGIGRQHATMGLDCRLLVCHPNQASLPTNGTPKVHQLWTDDDSSDSASRVGTIARITISYRLLLSL